MVYLNTTHVSVQLGKPLLLKSNFCNLNTTHVSVQSMLEEIESFMGDEFKYNPCIGSISVGKRINEERPGFKYNPCIGSISTRVSSIFLDSSFKYNPCIGSIMKTSSPEVEKKLFKYNPCIGSIYIKDIYNYMSAPFKYNPCIGSIVGILTNKCSLSNLNTTHVSVQLINK